MSSDRDLYYREEKCIVNLDLIFIDPCNQAVIIAFYYYRMHRYLSRNEWIMEVVSFVWELLKTCIWKVFRHWQNWTWSSSSMTVSSIISLWHVIIYIPLSWRIIKPSASFLFPMPLNLSAHLGLKKLIFWLPSRDYFFVWFWFRRTIHSRNRLNAFVLTTMINENLISLERDERRATDRHKSFVRAIDNYIKYGNRTVERTASKIS